MGITASDLITLAQNTKALSKEQLTRIMELAPKMTTEELESLKSTLSRVTEEGAKKEIEISQKVASHYSEWKADTTRNALQVQEGAVRLEDTAQAESLIQNI